MDQNQHQQRLIRLTTTQKNWWTFKDAYGDVLDKRNTPIGSVLFAWPTKDEADAWQTNLVRNHGAPLHNWSSSPMPYEALTDLLVTGNYNALILGELPGVNGVTLTNVRAT